MLQRYVRTADLPKVYAAVEKIMSAKSPATWKFQAFKIDNVVWSGLALTVILAKPPADVLGAQQQLIDAVTPYTVATGTAAAFDTTPTEPNINASTMTYATEFVPKSTARVCLRPKQSAHGHEGRRVHSGALRRSEGKRLDRH
jgi:hypothetical protein